MPKAPRWTASDAESALLAAGFEQLHSKGTIGFMGMVLYGSRFPFPSA
ncbi:MAG: hypothetical protein WBE37_23970 [Bryobacteraceae bacterium]